MMKWNPLVALLLTIAATGSTGCANKKGASAGPAVNESVTDVDVAPVPPREPSLAYAGPLLDAPPAAPAVPPVAPAAPAAVEPAPVVSVTPAADAGGKSYTVRKGDTLFSIARQFYGNGGQWQRIAGANPGLSPSTLKAGKTITIP
jgi:nucleoid-associated protein YgaU